MGSRREGLKKKQHIVEGWGREVERAGRIDSLTHILIGKNDTLYET